MNAWVAVRAVCAVAFALMAWTEGAGAQTDGADAPLREVQVAKSAFSRGDPTPAWVDPVEIPATEGAHPMVFPLLETQLMAARIPVVYVRRALRVNDGGSLTAAGQIPIAFVPQYQRLQLHAIRVLRGQERLDRTASSTVRFLQRESELEQGVYSDVITASILVSDLRVGDTLEYAYSLHGHNPVLGGKYVDGAGWDHSVPATLRRAVLHHPVGRKIAWRMIGDRRAAPLVPTESVRDGMRKLVFEERGLAAVRPEAYTPPDHPAYRWLQFSEFADWQEVVEWARGLYRVDAPLDAELRAVVSRLQARPSEAERVAAALEFVQSEIRYFAVALGESSHRPSEPTAVLKRRYGDCKDKSLLLITLLRALGIESHPVLLRLGWRRGLDVMLPSPLVFDHAIVVAKVGGRSHFLDPARLGQHGRLDRMGQAYDGAQVLEIVPGMRGLSTVTSVAPAEVLRDEVIETAVLPRFGGEAELTVRSIWRGLGAEQARVAIARTPRDQFIADVGNSLERRYPGTRLQGEPKVDDDRVGNVLGITATFKVPQLAVPHENRWLVRFEPVNLRGGLVSPPTANRAVPLGIPSFPSESHYTFDITFPDEVSVVLDPWSRAVESRHFRFAANRSFRGNRARTHVQFKPAADRVEVADLAKFAEDLRAVDQMIQYVVLVARNEVKGARAGATQKPSFPQSLRDRQQEVVDKVGRTISSGKLAGRDLADAHCYRGEALSVLGRLEEALRDANEALRLAPSAAEWHSCRAIVHLRAGEFDKSRADYSRAIALGEIKAGNYHQRGIANFYTGRFAEAAEDMARSRETSDKAAGLYSDLWAIWSYQRRGLPLPPDLAARAAAEPEGEWPRPALAMMAGKLSPEALLQLLDAKSGDERHMAQAEGYFYLGQYCLLIGDTAKAREFFEAVRSLEVIIYNEHDAAGFELKKLGQAQVQSK